MCFNLKIMLTLPICTYVTAVDTLANYCEFSERLNPNSEGNDN